MRLTHFSPWPSIRSSTSRIYPKFLAEFLIMNHLVDAKIFLTGGALVAASMVAEPAAADSGLALAAEVGADVVVTDLTDDDTLTAVGPALSLRLGYSFKVPMLRFTPEAKFSFESPGTPNSAAVLGGARLNVFDGLSPAVFAHAGGMFGDLEGVVWDAGVGLDFTVIPLIDFGIFGAYHRVENAGFNFGNAEWSSRDNYEWIQLGAQLALYF
jgi:hypothetical protein